MILLLLMAAALAFHLVGMANHGPGMVGGGCLALLLLGLPIVLAQARLLPVPMIGASWVSAPVPVLQTPGRDPPNEGTVLLL